MHLLLGWAEVPYLSRSLPSKTCKLDKSDSHLMFTLLVDCLNWNHIARECIWLYNVDVDGIYSNYLVYLICIIGSSGSFLSSQTYPRLKPGSNLGLCPCLEQLQTGLRRTRQAKARTNMPCNVTRWWDPHDGYAKPSSSLVGDRAYRIPVLDWMHVDWIEREPCKFESLQFNPKILKKFRHWYIFF